MTGILLFSYFFLWNRIKEIREYFLKGYEKLLYKAGQKSAMFYMLNFRHKIACVSSSWKTFLNMILVLPLHIRAYEAILKLESQQRVMKNIQQILRGTELRQTLCIKL